MEKKGNGLKVLIGTAAGFAVGYYWPKISASVREKYSQIKNQVEEAKVAATKAVNEEASKAKGAGEDKTEG